jgi:transposase-like protein
MQKKFSGHIKAPRSPKAVNEIQVNFCKLPTCKNYGIPADTKRYPQGRPRRSEKRDKYRRCGDRSPRENTPYMQCLLCGAEFPLKSNLAIHEEFQRFSEHLKFIPPPLLSCPNPNCSNHLIGINAEKKAYQKYGKTKSGYQRFKCKICGGTFSDTKVTKYQKKPHKNKLVFKLLVNKSPIKRICEVADLHPKAVYGKIDFFYQRCLELVGRRERHFSDQQLDRVYVGVDSQEYFVNWTNRKDKRNVKLTAVAAADNKTGYVFIANLNYDPKPDPISIEYLAKSCGDYELQKSFRQFARLWLQKDNDNNVKTGPESASKSRHNSNSLVGQIKNTYEKALARDDIEVFEEVDATDQLPNFGMKVHAEYTLYGSFYVLTKLFSKVKKVRFFLDQDAGMRAACLGAFQKRISSRTGDAFYVSIKKNLTVEERRKRLKESHKQLRQMMKMYSNMSEMEIKLMLIKQRLSEMKELGSWSDRWLRCPFPDMSEPEKAVCYLTDFGDYDIDHLAWLYNKASLHATDRFFMQLRRRVSLLERPFGSAINFQRIWHGYSPYNPFMITKMLTIFRTFYNYCLRGEKDRRTPAMRIGLAKSIVDIEDIIYGNA